MSAYGKNEQTPRQSDDPNLHNKGRQYCQGRKHNYCPDDEQYCRGRSWLFWCAVNLCETVSTLFSVVSVRRSCSVSLVILSTKRQSQSPNRCDMTLLQLLSAIRAAIAHCSSRHADSHTAPGAPADTSIHCSDSD